MLQYYMVDDDEVCVEGIRLREMTFSRELS